MDPGDIAARADLAREIAAEAGAVALGHWRTRGDLSQETKGDPRDLVSEADRAVERLLRERIGAVFPEDGILGEEYGLEPGTTGATWVLDPIDGTVPFLHGMPSWCVAIAVVAAGRTVAAAVAVPAEGTLLAARAGGGATLDGAPMRIDPAVTLQAMPVGLGASHRSDPETIAGAVRDLMQAGGVFFRNGSGALMLSYVAAGRLSGYFEPHMHAWDCLGAMLLIEEAGGICAPLGPDGHDPFTGGRVLAAAPGAEADLMRLFGTA